jgi:hypothetical protein
MENNNDIMRDVVVHLLQECNEDEPHFISLTKNNMFNLSWTNIKSALVSGVIMGILAIAAYIIGVGDIFSLNFHSLANAGALATLVTIVSLFKSFITTETGTVAGIQVVPPITPTPSSD